MSSNPKIRCTVDSCGCPSNSFIWISHEHKAIWYEIPRSASTSIKESLMSVGFKKLPLSPDNATERYEEYFQFTLVRNPYTRLLSTKEMMHHSYRFGRLGIENLDIPRFINFLQNKNKADHHTLPCSAFLPSDLKNVEIFHFENFHSDWNKLNKRLNSNFPLSHLSNQRTGGTLNTESLRRQDLLDIIHDYYKEDFENFDYKKLEVK